MFFQCSCAGMTKRRVQCMDIKLNKQSNNCPIHDKLPTRQTCPPPPNCKWTVYKLIYLVGK